MNTPNKLTMLRIILIPFFVVFLLGNFSTWSKWMALAIFVIASLTDMLDGYLARRDNLVTNFGKFMDPLADSFTFAPVISCDNYAIIGSDQSETTDNKFASDDDDNDPARDPGHINQADHGRTYGTAAGNFSGTRRKLCGKRLSGDDRGKSSR